MFPPSEVAMLPVCIALFRGHKSVLAIVVLNVISVGLFILLMPIGFLMWVFGVIWSLTGNTWANEKRKAKLLAAQMQKTGAST